MKCDELRLLIPLLLSDDLSAEQAAKALRHLELCARCNGLFRDESLVRERMQAAFKAERVPDNVRKFFATTLAAPARDARGWWYAAAAVVLIACTLFDFSDSAESTTLAPGVVARGTTFWGSTGVQQSERTPLVDVQRLQDLSLSERTLEGAALVAFYSEHSGASMTASSPPPYQKAGFANNSLLEATVPAERTRVFEITHGIARTMELSCPAKGILAGARVEGDADAQVIVVRNDDQHFVLVTSGRLRPLKIVLESASSR